MNLKKIRTGLILAAGMGTRLGKLNENKPKGLLKIGKASIIEESILKLLKSGIKKIFIITGFKHELYEELFFKKFPEVELIKNSFYKTSNTLYSLSMARTFIKEDFLLLESDLIYEYEGLDQILNCEDENLILISGKTNNGDEVFVRSKENNLISMSKNLEKLNGIYSGEFVGISKISINLFKEMMEIFDNSSNRKELSYEEDALVECAKKIKIKCLLLEKLLWSEIDDENHLKRAKKIYKSLNN